jgi:ATP-dependent Clp protease ATP-binding subunit ClpA
MSEYQEKHTVARLIGAPPDMWDTRKGGFSRRPSERPPTRCFCWTQIEKAHQDIFNTLLQVMDYATLTTTTERRADFRNVIIIMTSNAGAREIGKQQMGFGERTVRDEAITSAIEGSSRPNSATGWTPW